MNSEFVIGTPISLVGSGSVNRIPTDPDPGGDLNRDPPGSGALTFFVFLVGVFLFSHKTA